MLKFGSSDPLPAQKCRYRISNGSCQLASTVHKCVSTSTPVHKCSEPLRAPRKVFCGQIDPLPPLVSVLLIELVTSPMGTFGGFELLFALLVLITLHHHLKHACIIMSCTMIAETSFDRQLCRIRFVRGI